MCPNNRRIFSKLLYTAVLVSGLVLQGCVSGYSFAPMPSSNSSESTSVPAPSPTSSSSPMPSPSASPMPSPTPSPSQTVCDPFGDGSGTNASNGLQASLTYIPVSDISSLGSLMLADFAPGAPDVVQENAAIFLSSLDVPTENFELGFATSNGTPLKDLNGNTLTQYFALNSVSNLMIQSGDTANPPGNYQLAVLSDDGSIVYVGSPGGSSATQELINNDGGRSNTLACASQTISLQADQPVPLDVNYFQGPQYSIALMLLWRPIPSGSGSSALQDPACGVEEGDTYYFTEATPNQPTANFTALLSRGWQVIPSSYYYLNSGTTNPCATPSP